MQTATQLDQHSLVDNLEVPPVRGTAEIDEARVHGASEHR